MKNVAVEFDASDYRRSHLTAPRGRGSWAFSTVDPRRADYLNHTRFFSGTYREAKAQAAAWAREQLAARSSAPLTGDALLVLYVCA